VGPSVTVRLLDICDAAIAAAITAGADDAEACAARVRSVNVQLQKNDVHIAKSADGAALGIRVIKAGRLGFSFLNRLDEPSIRESVAAALGIAAAAPADPHNVLPDPVTIEYQKGLSDPAADSFGVDRAVGAALSMLREARGYDHRVTVDFGEFAAHWGERAVASSRGVRASEPSSAFQCSILGMARDGETVSSFDYQFDGAREASGVDPAAIARRFAENVVDSLGAVKGEGFRGPVILAPKAAAEVVCYPIEAAVSARAVQKGTSRFCGKLGERVASRVLTIVDDSGLPGGLGSASFDREGLPSEVLPLVEDGVLRNYLYDAYSACVDGRRSNGHAGGGPADVPHVSTTNVVMSPGEVSLADMIAGVDRGVLVTRFSGNVDPVSGDFSGVVKGGRLIRRGKLAEPLCGTMIAGNTFDLLPGVVAVSRERERMPGSLVGHVLLSDVVVSGS
jgi:PmbA protein